jgi:hypothetical protein
VCNLRKKIGLVKRYAVDFLRMGKSEKKEINAIFVK